VARVGLLGGTFNPPHLAHLVCAQEALVQLRLDRVLLVPARVPPHKAVEADPGVAHRVAMCEAAVAGDDRLGVSRADAERSEPAYTVDLLRALRAAAPDDELSFIVGGDMAYSLPTWREPEELLALARLAVAEREGVRRAAAGITLRYLVPDGVAAYIARERLYTAPRPGSHGTRLSLEGTA
jgi:nicotinate-nucleotide adenylyltransferase